MKAMQAESSRVNQERHLAERPGRSFGEPPSPWEETRPEKRERNVSPTRAGPVFHSSDVGMAAQRTFGPEEPAPRREPSPETATGVKVRYRAGASQGDASLLATERKRDRVGGQPTKGRKGQEHSVKEKTMRARAIGASMTNAGAQGVEPCACGTAHGTPHGGHVNNDDEKDDGK